MIRRLAVAVGLAVILSIQQLSAQAVWTAPVANWGSYWCPTCYVALNLDTPNLETPFAGTLQGWAFECASGHPIDRVDVYYKNAQGMHRAKTYLAAVHIARPDVAAYARATCPTVTSTAGFAIGFREPIPSGTWTIAVVAWKGMMSTTQTGLIVVP